MTDYLIKYRTAEAAERDAKRIRKRGHPVIRRGRVNAVVVARPQKRLGPHGGRLMSKAQKRQFIEREESRLYRD